MKRPKGRFQLTALPLVRNPFADIGWAAPQFDSFGFRPNKNLHSVTADQLYLCEVDGDDSASVERHANELKIFLCKPAANAKQQTLFSRKSVDSIRHWLARRPFDFNGNRHAIRM